MAAYSLFARAGQLIMIQPSRTSFIKVYYFWPYVTPVSFAIIYLTDFLRPCELETFSSLLPLRVLLHACLLNV